MKALIMAAALTLSASAFAGECFNSRFADGWNYDSHKDVLVVDVFPGQYEIKARFCNQLAWADRIGFQSFSNSFVCAGDRINVMDAWNRVIETCPIDSITKIK